MRGVGVGAGTDAGVGVGSMRGRHRRGRGRRGRSRLLLAARSRRVEHSLLQFVHACPLRTKLGHKLRVYMLPVLNTRM